MVFSSIIFLLYFLPVFLSLYFISPTRWKNEVALAGSCFFYAWGAPEFFFAVFVSLILDFYLVHLFSIKLSYSVLTKPSASAKSLEKFSPMEFGSFSLMVFINASH